MLAWATLALNALCSSVASGAGLQAPSPPTGRLRVGVGAQQALEPPFFSTPRDRLTAELSGEWRPDPRVALQATVDALRWDLYGHGERHLGGGDIRLGTWIRLWPGTVEGGLGWQVKLPDAEDEPELGTDETDVGLTADLSGTVGPVRLRGGGGVDLRGDPGALRSRLAVPLLDLSLETGLATVVGWLRLHGELPSGAEPGRALLTLGGEAGCPLSAGGALLWGPTAAGPRVGGRIFVGWRAGCGAPTGSPAAAEGQR